MEATHDPMTPIIRAVKPSCVAVKAAAGEGGERGCGRRGGGWDGGHVEGGSRAGDSALLKISKIARGIV